MVDETEANAVADASAAGVGTQQSETNYSDKGRAAVQNASNESDQDIGADESMAAQVAQALMAWEANKKRTYDRVEGDLDAAIKAGQSHVARLHTIQELQLSNAVIACNQANNARMDHHNIFIDRVWNVNETDALSVLLNKVTGDAI